MTAAYTVLWDPDLEAQFIHAWVGSDSQTRGLLTDIANWIDANLAADPDLKGREESTSVRILAVPISAARASVAYQVLPEDRQVRVIRLVFRR
jgi:hypothetical protein